MSVEQNIVVITKGEQAEFDIFLEKDTYPRPFDLTDYDEFKVCFPTVSGDALTITEVANANGSIVAKVSPDVLGQLKVTLGVNDTQLLIAKFSQDIDLEWNNSLSPAPKRKRLHKVLHVEDSICA